MNHFIFIANLYYMATKIIIQYFSFKCYICFLFSN